MAKQTTVEDHMTPNHVAAFLNAARLNKLYILVRRTNPASLKYVGKPGYIGKRIDCKAKTADNDTGGYERKGLVVDPYLAGDAAFSSHRRFADARKCWESFRKNFKSVMSRFAADAPNAQHREMYFLDEDIHSKHYGCVLYTSDWVTGAACYVHGDYDLYDIVSASRKSRNVVFFGSLHGEIHTHGPYLSAVQCIVNSVGRTAMVLHGSQAKYMAHTDEPVDVFFPDGSRMLTLENETAIREFYKIEFQGREAHSAH